MSDKSKNNPEVLEKGGISRRNFLGASAVTGAAVAGHRLRRRGDDPRILGRRGQGCAAEHPRRSRRAG